LRRGAARVRGEGYKIEIGTGRVSSQFPVGFSIDDLATGNRIETVAARVGGIRGGKKAEDPDHVTSIASCYAATCRILLLVTNTADPTL
jgi:hypothetical protein